MAVEDILVAAAAIKINGVDALNRIAQSCYFALLSTASCYLCAEPNSPSKDIFEVLNSPEFKQAYEEKLRLAEPEQKVIVKQNIPFKINMMLPSWKRIKTIEIVSPPSHGVISGIFPDATYIPNNNFYGTDKFTYRFNAGTDVHEKTLIVRRPTFVDLKSGSAIYDLDIGEDYIGFHWSKSNSAALYEIYVSEIEDEPPTLSSLYKTVSADQLSIKVENLNLGRRYNISVVPINEKGEQDSYYSNIFATTMRTPDHSVLKLIHDPLDLNGGEKPRIEGNTLFLEKYTGSDLPEVGHYLLIYPGSFSGSEKGEENLGIKKITKVSDTGKTPEIEFVQATLDSTLQKAFRSDKKDTVENSTPTN